MYIGCDACGEEISSKDCGCSEKARKRAKAQYDKINELESKLNDIKNSVFIVIDEIAQRKIEGENDICITPEVMEQLWQSADCRWWEIKTSDCFLSRELMRGDIILNVIDLFMSRPHRWKKTANEIVSFDARLEHIRESFIKYHKFYYGNEPSIDLSTKDVIQGIKKL